MKEKIIKENIKKFIKNGFIGRFKNITFKFWLCHIYIIHKMLVFLKNHLNYLNDNISWTFKV